MADSLPTSGDVGYKNFATPWLQIVSVLVIGCVLVSYGSVAHAQKPAPNQLTPSERRQILATLEEEQRELRPYDEPDEAQRYELSKRVRKGESLPVEKYFEARRRLANMPVFSSPEGRVVAPKAGNSLQPLLAGISSWSSLGPGNVGGRTRALVIDPAAPNTLYAGAAGGGIWKSTDQGKSWVPMGDFLSNIAVSVLVVDASSPLTARVLYAGTGEGYLNSDAIRGAGIFKSTDSGNTWARLGGTTTDDFAYVNDIVISPTNAQVLYASTRTGVWKSVNGGAAWTRVLKDDGSGGANATLVDTSQDTGMLDLAIRADSPAGKDIVFATSGSFTPDGIYRTTDSGQSWARVHTADDIGRTTLAIAPSAQGTIYALSAKTTYRLLNVFRSTDGGTTWEARIPGAFNPQKLDWLLLTNPIFAIENSCFNASNQFLSQGWYDNTIAVSPTNPNTIFVGGVDLFRSDDGGTSFGVISYWWILKKFPQYAHADQHTLVFDPGWDGTSNQTLYVGNDGGIFKTSNALGAVGSGDNRGLCFFSPSVPGEVTWSNLNNGYAVTQFYHGAVYPNGQGYFGGTQDNGTVRGAPDAQNAWEELVPGDGGYCAVDPTTSGNSRTLFLENIGLSIQKSIDNGARFLPATTGIRGDIFGFIAPFAMDPRKPQILWTGGLRPWRTTNSADSWTDARGSDFTGNPVTAIGISPSDSGTVYMGTNSGRVFRTANGLDPLPTWTGSGGLPFGWCSWIAVDPQDPNTAYATYTTFGIGHLWKTTNGGTSWANIDGSGDKAIPDIPVHCIAVHPTVSRVLYVGTDLGVLVSTDGGQSWNLENTGFANVATQTLVWESTATPGVPAFPPSLYAFTHGRGVFRAEVNINPPNPPSPLVAATFGGTSVGLVWSRNNANELGFSLERKTGANGKFVVIQTLPKMVTSTSDSVQEGTQYTYRMRTIGEGGYSVYSNEFTVRTPGIAPPSNLRASPLSTVDTSLTWTDNSYNETGFVIERKPGKSGSFFPIALVRPNITTYTDTKLTEGIAYFYRVKCIGIDGEGVSGYSNEDSPTPATPTNLKAQAVSFSQVDLTWNDNSTNEITYIVERRRAIEESWEVLTVLPANSTGFSNTNASPGTQYFYRVKAINTFLVSEYSNEAVVTTPVIPEIPFAPTNLTATAVSISQVTLQWVDASANETGFILERRAGTGGEFTQLATLAANLTRYDDLKVLAGTSYVYRIRATNAGGNSSFSNEATVTTPGVAPPTDLLTDVASPTEINLTWTDNSFNETGFRVERKTGITGSFSLVGMTAANLTTLKDSGLTPQTQYVYRVTAVSAAGDSAYSNEAVAVTKAASPVITGVSPNKGRVGTLITLTGNNLGGARVLFGSTQVGLVNSTAERLQFAVPPSPKGKAIITVTTAGGSANSDFKVK